MRASIFLLFAICLGVLFILIAVQFGPSHRSLEATPKLIPPEHLRSFTLGYSDVVADSLWLRAIQDFDYCENRSEFARNVDAVCNQGWVYKMISSVIDLAPEFRQPYYSGAVMLSIVVNDVSGASKIFDRAVEKFPHDYSILYAAAYQALIEERKDSKAADLLVRAAKEGGPPWLYALAGKLHLKSGQLQLAKSVLTDAMENMPPGAGAERLQQRLDEVEAELAKQPKQ